jgi:sec-independent protein translocase protein TatC
VAETSTRASRASSLLADLGEARRRLLWVAAVLGLGTAAGFVLSPTLFSLLTAPAGSLVYLAPAEALLSKLRLALAAGGTLALPAALVNVAAFAGHRLPGRVRRGLYFCLALSFGLFAGGLAFALRVVLPMVLRFFLSFQTERIRPLLALGQYVDFVFGLVIPFGLIFQLPLLLAALARFGLLRPDVLSRQRRMAILVIFIVAAVLTPPDVVSQIMMALPMLVLYELGVLLARLAWRERGRGAEERS